MAVDNRQLAYLNTDYSAQTGIIVQKFVCPISLDDDSNAELCDGHILNQGIKKASRATVIQRKDIDNYFGHTIEPDLVKMLNIPVSTKQELIRKARNLRITAPSGEKMETFRSNTEAGGRFQQINLFNPDRTTMISPFLKNGRLENKYYKDLEVEFTITVTNSAIIGSLLKSGYLALFQMLGYRWVLDASGDRVRRALAAFYRNKADKEQSINYFSEFDGSISVLFNDTKNDMGDTLEDGSLFFHYVEGDQETGLLFAVTCLFRVNDRTLSVTLPCYQKKGYYLVAYQYYQTLLKDRSVCQNVYSVRFDNERFNISTTPLRLHYKEKPKRLLV
jgi:hypothetical protein